MYLPFFIDMKGHLYPRRLDQHIRILKMREVIRRKEEEALARGDTLDLGKLRELDDNE
jgi:hypothetical protein